MVNLDGVVNLDVDRPLAPTTIQLLTVFLLLADLQKSRQVRPGPMTVSRKPPTRTTDNALFQGCTTFCLEGHTSNF